MDFRWRNKNVFHTLVNGGRDEKEILEGTLKPKEMQKVAVISYP
jgi:hypothetical protein